MRGRNGRAVGGEGTRRADPRRGASAGSGGCSCAFVNILCISMSNYLFSLSLCLSLSLSFFLSFFVCLSFSLSLSLSLSLSIQLQLLVVFDCYSLFFLRANLVGRNQCHRIASHEQIWHVSPVALNNLFVRLLVHFSNRRDFFNLS